jgi:hypothetical protein
MSDSICFNRDIFLTMVFVVIVATALYMFNSPQGGKFCPPCIQEPCQNKVCPPCENKVCPKKDDVPKQITVIDNVEVTDPIREMDYRRLEDPLSPPFRRLPRHAYPAAIKNIINYPTRGYPDNFHYVGNLMRQNDQKFIKLFGRQTYPGSNKYEYYGITTDPNGMETKIQIKSPKDDELMSDDEVDVEIFGNGGKFKLYLNEYDQPRYNPFLY